MSNNMKTKSERLVSNRPEQADWDDPVDEVHVRQKIEQGERAAEEGRVVAHNEVRKRFVLESLLRTRIDEGLAGNVSGRSVSDILNEEMTKGRGG